MAEPLLSVRDAEQAATQILPADIMDFIAGGSEAEITLAANRAALDAVFLTPRMLTGITACDAGTTLAGSRSALPVAIAPMSYHRLVSPDAELGMAQAAKEAGIPLILSMMSSCPLEEVAAVGATLWQQLYLLRDRSQVTGMVRRAEEAGCAAREMTALPLVLKGILDPSDARRAVEHGVSAIVVSNHGGRQLDGAIPSAAALPGVCEVVRGRCQVFLDSGIRGGTDVLRALALGASGALLGRPALWGLASGGAPGAARVLSLLAEELTDAMHLAGCADVKAARSLRAGGLRHDTGVTGR